MKRPRKALSLFGVAVCFADVVMRVRDISSMYDLEEAGNVKADTNLGIDADAAGDLGNNALVPNGKDINIAGGAIKNGYTATVEKTGNLEAADYSECVMELVGTGVGRAFVG